MKRLKLSLLLIGTSLFAYACATSCGPGPGQSTAPASYPSGYTLEKQAEKAPSK
ncbi:MAG TPA: hypothetical protein VMT71_11255 [Syntrophorhabdales bacterium]|nr:hypothetical protein [Syntrophorhabdales bacterium]